MKPAARSGIAPLLTAIVSASTPGVALGQLTSARPASVSLTVVVPPRPDASVPILVAPLVNVVAVGANAIDLETSITMGERVASRVEVSPGRGWPADATRVWVRNARGELERLATHGRVIAFDQPAGASAVPSVRFRVESDQPFGTPALDLPVEYRVRIGTGDAVSTWTFASSLRVEAARELERR